MASLSKCRSCGVTIIFAKNVATGNTLCIDSEPVADGNIVLLGEDARIVLKRDLPVKLMPAYKSHHATCPNAAQHRKPR